MCWTSDVPVTNVSGTADFEYVYILCSSPFELWFQCIPLEISTLMIGFGVLTNNEKQFRTILQTLLNVQYLLSLWRCNNYIIPDESQTIVFAWMVVNDLYEQRLTRQKISSLQRYISDSGSS